MGIDIVRKWIAPTIQNKLLVLMFLVAFVPLLVLGSLGYVKARQSIINQVGERLQASSLVAISQINQSIGFAKQNVLSWAELDILQQVERSDPEGKVSDLLTNLQNVHDFYSTLVAVDMDGHIAAAGDSDLVGISVQNTAWFEYVIHSGRPYMSKLALDPELGGYGVSIAYPVFKKYGGSSIIGVIKVNVDWFALLKLVQSVNVLPAGQSELGYAVLLDQDGYVLAAPGFILLTDEGSTEKADMLKVFGQRWWAAENTALFERLQGEASHRLIRRSDNDLILANISARNFEHLASTGWSLVLVRDARDALGGIQEVRQKSILIGLIVVGFTLIAISIVARQLGRPIVRLSQWAKEVSGGNLNAKIEIKSKDELGELANSLDNMRRDIKYNMDELRDSKDRYQAIIDSIDCVIWEAQIQPLKVTLISGRIENILGLTAIEAQSRIRNWRQWVHPDHHSRVIEAFRYSLDNACENYVEFKLRFGDSGWVWVKELISVVIEGLKVVGLRGVLVDINDVVKATEDMVRARDIALETAENKSRFMSVVSHEIRTPMNGMLGMLDMLSDTGMDKEQKDVLGMAIRSGRNLLSLVDDVMDFSRLQAGNIKFKNELCDVHEIFNSSISFVSAEAYKKGLDIGVVMETSLQQYLETDGTKLRQVLTSLLSNAVKFTSHGSILLWAELVSGNRLYVEVKDTGMGVESQHQVHLFQPFIQGDLSNTRKYGGSGLGLALCQGIVEAMDGKIGVKSIQGVGSSFFFELPVVIPEGQHSCYQDARNELQKYYPDSTVLLIGDLPATQLVMKMACEQWGIGFQWVQKENRVVRNLDAVLLDRKFRWIFIAQEISDQFWEKLNPYLGSQAPARIIQLRLPAERYGQRPLPHLYVPFTLEQLALCMLGKEVNNAVEGGDLPLQKGRLPTVLVVDDNEVNRRVACGYLRKLGFSCDIAEDGSQALKAVKNNDYGMVFMDCQMPVMDGFEATRAIREYLQGQSLPIIAVTANAMEGDKEKCLMCGMDDYIAKPLRKEGLKQVIERWLNSTATKAAL